MPSLSVGQGKWSLYRKMCSILQRRIAFVCYVLRDNPWSAEIFFLYKSREQRFFYFEIIIHIIVSSFRFTWIPMSVKISTGLSINMLIGVLGTWRQVFRDSVWGRGRAPRGYKLICHAMQHGSRASGSPASARHNTTATFVRDSRWDWPYKLGSGWHIAGTAVLKAPVL